MRFTRLLLPALATLVLLLPAASAHVTVTAQQPALPMAFDQPTVIDGSISMSCATLISEYGGAATLVLTAAPGGPGWLNATGTKLAFTQAECVGAAVAGSLTKTGTVTLTPSPNAPALEIATLTIGTAKDGSTTMEGGDVAALNVSIAYHGNLTSLTDETEMLVEHGERVDFVATFRVYTNGKSMIMLTEDDTPEDGNVTGLNATVDVFAPSVDGLEYRDVEIPLVYEAPTGDFHGGNYTITAQLMSYDDPTAVSTPVTLTWHFEHPHEEAEETASTEAPGPDFAIILVAVVVGFVALRRRTQ